MDSTDNEIVDPCHTQAAGVIPGSASTDTPYHIDYKCTWVAEELPLEELYVPWRHVPGCDSCTDVYYEHAQMSIDDERILRREEKNERSITS